MTLPFYLCSRQGASAWRCKSSTDEEISVKTDLAKGDIVIEVSDTGPGILKDDLDHIFDPFYTGKKKMGLCVVLPVCHGIIKDHEGTITVKKSPEGGAVFIIKLPVG